MRFFLVISFLFLGFTGAGLWACRTPETTPISPETRLGHDFFPLETGRFVEYDVSEIQYSLVAVPTTMSYQLKEVTGEAFVNAEGLPSYRLERYRRGSAAQPWRLDSVWTARRETARAIRTENNIAYVKLFFPVQEGSRWNGNALNVYGKSEYEIRRLDQPLTINGQVFDRTLTVVQRADSSLVSLARRTEQYARTVGLIYKETTQLYYCNTPDCLGKGKIDFGTQKIYRVRAYGKE
ncbi:MAG: hypothetical protein LH606_16175 [Cytophagaceae bacterium]|nr:hypothetical protein [Cytophagaceae bacterium]